MSGDPVEPLPGMPTRAEIAADPEAAHRKMLDSVNSFRALSPEQAVSRLGEVARALAERSRDPVEREHLLAIAESAERKLDVRALAQAIAEAVGVEINCVQRVDIFPRPDGSTWVTALVAAPRECKACRERGSKRGLAMWEWRQWQNGGVGWPGQLPDHVADDGAPLRPWSFSRADGTGNVWMRACRPCPACAVDGKPTGVER